MPLRVEVQRICARGRDGLPQKLVCDGGAISRWAAETDPSSAPPLPNVLDAVSRTRRHVLWMLGTTAFPGPVAPASSTWAATIAGSTRGAQIVTSTGPVGPTLVRALGADPRDVGIVTAGIDERPYELWPLGFGVDAVLDIATGKLWTADLVATAFGASPAYLPMLFALTGAEPGHDVLTGRDGSKPENQALVVEVLRTGGDVWTDARLPLRFRQLASRKRSRIEQRAVALSGWNAIDLAAALAIGAWLASRPVLEQRADTAYLAADVATTRGQRTLRSVTVFEESGKVAVFRGAAAEARVSKLLRERPNRWFVPHALDLLGFVHDRGLDVPRRVVDPAIVAFVLDPDGPLDLPGACRSVRGLPGSAQAWLGDYRRRLPTPSRLRDIVALLPAVDRELAAIVAGQGQTKLLEDDIAATIPVLAKIERGGARIGTPTLAGSWNDVREQMQQRLDRYEKSFVALPNGEDPYTAAYDSVVNELKALGKKVPASHWHGSLSARQELLRLAGTGCKQASALLEARSLASPSGTYYWVNKVTSGRTHLRGTLFPQRTGRWGFEKLPMQNLIKHQEEAKIIRSGLVPPDGYRLVGADFNAFEVRLLAALSGDPFLLDVAQWPDVHKQIAMRMYGFAAARQKRELVKKVLYAIVYGQTSGGFWRNQPDMSIAEAEQLYDDVRARIPGVFVLRRRLLRDLNRYGHVSTPGGWRRYRQPGRGFARKAFNTVVQGLGADILRWLLRRIAHETQGADVIFVHQAHDELILAAREDDVAFVRGLIRELMEQEVAAKSGLLPRPVRLVAKVRTGITWGDLI